MSRSFRVQLTLLFGSLALALAALLTYELGGRLTQQAQQQRGDALAKLAGATAVLLAEGLHERSREVDLLARSNDAQRLGLDAAGWQVEIARLLSGRPHYAWVGITDAAGTVVAASQGMLLGADVSQRPWFRGALQGLYVGDVHTAKLLAKLLPAPPGGEPLRFIDFAAPLRDAQGQLVGTLGVHADWRWARDVIELLHSEDTRDAGVQVLIVDRAGHVIHAPQGPQTAVAAPTAGLARQPAGASVQTWSDGLAYLTAAAVVPPRTAMADLGWTVVARQPADEALRGAQAARRAAWVIGLLAAWLSMLIVWLGAGRFSRPLERISLAAELIHGGDRQVAIPITRQSTELARLSSSLASMTHDLVSRGEALSEANRQLERRVAERTEALARANAELECLAHQDGLTGLANRRAVDLALEKAIAQHRRHGRELGVLLADLDHFKRINDTHGHEAGDQVLRAFGECLRGALREGDLAARFGGEEFLILLPETDHAGVQRVGEKLRAALAALELQPVGRVTASFGGAVWNEGETATAFVKRADAALYAAKQAGRDRVVLADEPALALFEPA